MDLIMFSGSGLGAKTAKIRRPIVRRRSCDDGDAARQQLQTYCKKAVAHGYKLWHNTMARMETTWVRQRWIKMTVLFSENFSHGILVTALVSPFPRKKIRGANSNSNSHFNCNKSESLRNLKNGEIHSILPRRILSAWIGNT